MRSNSQQDNKGVSSKSKLREKEEGSHTSLVDDHHVQCGNQSTHKYPARTHL